MVHSRMSAVIIAMMMVYGAQAAITVEIAVALPLPTNALVPEKLRQAVASILKVLDIVSLLHCTRALSFENLIVQGH